MGRVFFNTRKNIHALDGAYTMLASDSGKVFTVSSAAGAYEVTMPTTVANLEGFHCTFKVWGLWFRFNLLSRFTT